MPRTLLSLLLLLSTSSVWGTPGIGIHNLGVGLRGETSYTSPSGYNSAAAGSSFLVIVAQGNSGTPTISDTFGNTYTAPTFTAGANPVIRSGTGTWLYAYLCSHCTGGSNHEITVTQASGLYIVEFIEITGAAASPLDQSNGEFTTTLPTVCPVTPTAASELVIGIVWISNSGAAITPNGGFTALDAANDSGWGAYASAYLLNPSETAQDPAFTQSEGANPAAITLSFKAATISSPSMLLSNDQPLISNGESVVIQ